MTGWSQDSDLWPFSDGLAHVKTFSESDYISLLNLTDLAIVAYDFQKKAIIVMTLRKKQ